MATGTMLEPVVFLCREIVDIIERAEREHGDYEHLIQVSAETVMWWPIQRGVRFDQIHLDAARLKLVCDGTIRVFNSYYGEYWQLRGAADV